MAGMQLKSATTSRASSPGSTNGRERSHAWPTFSTVSETIGPDVWRNENEADMRRREVEAEERKKRSDRLAASIWRWSPRLIYREDGATDPNDDGLVQKRIRCRILAFNRRADSSCFGCVDSSPVEAISVVDGISMDGSNKVSTNGVSADVTAKALGDGSGKASVDGSSKAAADGMPTSASPDLPVKNATVNGHRKDSINEIKRSPSVDSRNGSTPPTAKAFAHIWPPPSIATHEPTKKGRKKAEPEPAPSRSFITQRNLPPAPPPIVPADEDTKDNVNGAKDAGSSLRSMLTTMPPRAVFMSAAMMKDALNVLLDPATDELLKDYVQPERAGSGSKLERSGSVSKLERSGSTSKLERSNSQRSASQSKDDDRSSRDGTPAQGRKPVDASDHMTLEFRAWVRRMFSTVKTPRGEDALAFGGKPVTVEDDIYETIIRRIAGLPCVVEAFVQECPGCPASNKVTSATSKPKKRKWVRKDDKQPATTTKRKPATGRRGKGGRKKKPADESEEEQEQEPEQEVEEQEEEDELGEEPEPEPEAEPEVEEDEMESEDETIARPASSKMDLDG
ncbi:Fungal Zn(2)-Cys(6) binuclear cluster domain [Ceratobasidium sp. AG-Ba]|nr:Fungal Zn(2)-Cys(6) binuclear cluster domain [Ceratobasidium sp. AG-Ba]